VRRYGGVTANGTDPGHHTGLADGAGAEVAVPPPRRAGPRSLACSSEPTTTQLPLL
jgi:hypothetical protein